MDNIINLIEHLNKNGKSHDISFTIDEEEYEFRILTSGGGVGFKEQFFHGGRKKAEAVVMTPDCELLFIVARGSRITKGGAYNAVSKEIAKQLGKYLKALDKIHGASNQSDSGC